MIGNGAIGRLNKTAAIPFEIAASDDYPITLLTIDKAAHDVISD
jgi:hypothetical protein